MKKSLFVVLFAVFFMLAIFTQASAGATLDQILKKKELVVGTNATFPPFAFKAKDGKIKGFDVDLAKSIAAAMGVKVKVVHINFGDLISSLEAQKVDIVISAMTMEPKRNLRIAFVGPYFVSGQSLLLSKATAESVKATGDMNNAGFSIAVPKGTTTEALARKIMPKARIVAAATAETALQQLLNKRVKAMMADFPFCTIEAFRHKSSDLLTTKPLSFEPLGVAVRIDDPLLINMLQNYLLVIQGNGEMQAINQYWFGDPKWLDELPK